MAKSIYEMPEIKTKDKRFKSVFVTDQYFENCLIVGVEAYDNVGYNALNTTIQRFDDFYMAINKLLVENFEHINQKTDKVRVIIHSEMRTNEYILTKSGEIF